MLKTIIMLDCNICGQPFDHIAVSKQSDPMAWKALASDVEWEAELCGWSFYRGAHHCSFCISDITFSLRQAADELAAAKNTRLPSSLRPEE